MEWKFSELLTKIVYHDRSGDKGAIGNIYIYDPYHGCAWTYGNLSGVFHDNDLDEISHGNRYGSQD